MDELGGHQERVPPSGRETRYHPALDARGPRTMPAGKAIAVIAVAMVVVGLLSSGWMVRTGEGMPPGPGRSVVLALASPFDAVATTLSLDRPRRGLDTLLGRAPLVGGEELESGDESILAARVHTGIVPEPGASPVAGTNRGSVGVPAVRRPTTDHPIELLVMGDSLSTYPAEHLEGTLAPGRLVDVTQVFRNGTGLATPRAFNWQAFARQQVETRQPEAVVMLIGGNDDVDMTRNGRYYSVGTAEWQTEYARRVAVVMRTMIDLGVQRVYWSGPPTAADPDANRHFEAVNAAVARAAAAVPGVRFVDLYRGTAVAGAYSDEVEIDGRTVDARMRDGVHWTWKGAVQPARLILQAVEADFGPLGSVR